MIFESLGKLNDWAASNRIEVVDAGQPLLSYDPDGTAPKGRRLPPVRTVVDFICRHIASLPLKVYRRMDDDSRERVRDGVLADLIADPRPGPLGAMSLWWALIADGLLHDRFCAVLELDQDGAPRLRRLPPRLWSIRADFTDEVTGIRIADGDGEWVDLDYGDSPFVIGVGYATNSAKGESQLRTLKTVLAEYQESIDYRAAVNKNGPRSPLAILRDKPWPDKDSRERFERGIKNFVRGGGSEGSGLVLEDGMKPESLNGFKPIDVGDLEARDKVKLDVANAYGIPGEIMGLRQGNFSNMQAFQQALYGTYLRPYIQAFEEALNPTLVNAVQPGEGLYVEFDLDAQLRGNPVEQYAAMSTASGRPFLTTNEIRAGLNKPKIDGGDDLVTPLNVLVGGQTSPQDGTTEGRGGGELQAPVESGGVNADDFAKAANSVGILVRSGFDPESSRAAAGLPQIEHLGLLPVTLRDESVTEAEAAQAEAEAQQAVDEERSDGSE